MTDTILGPWHLPENDPLITNAQRALTFLRPKVIDAFTPGQVLLQSTLRPRLAPSWAWGYTPAQLENWVSRKHPYVIEEYTVNHELGHCFDSLLLTPTDRKVLMLRMGVPLADDLTDGQINLQWRRGSYTDSACFVPREGFADAFAKAQAQAPASPDDPAENGFRNVLPNFYKTNIAATDFRWFLRYIKAVDPATDGG